MEQRSFQDNAVQNNTPLVLMVRGIGGVLRRQQPTGKAEAMTAVKKKIEKNYKSETPDHPIAEDDTPASFRAYVSEYNQKVAEFVLMKTTIGEHFVATCLKQMSTEKLQLLKTIFTNVPGKKKLTNEEKVERALPVIFPQIKTLGVCQTKLVELEGETIVKLFHLFIEEFHLFSEQTGKLQMDGALFLKKIDAVLESRLGEASDVSSDAVASQCVVQ